MKKITVSAPGKLMLFGEHAVVYNHPCIVTAVGQRMKVTLETTNEKTFELIAPEVNIINYKKSISNLGKGEIPKGANFVEIAVKNFKEKFPFKNGIRINTKSEFSSKFGFGSSSASAVCTIKALSEIIKIKLAPKQIFDLAYKTVLDIQKKGSGFDVAAAVCGGTLYFFTGGKIIKPLKVKSLPLIVGFSGIKADTVSLLNKVLEKKKKYPKVIDDIFNQIEDIVELAKTALIKSDWKEVGELMDFNEGLLESLGVGSKKLSDMIYAAKEASAYGAKISGAGGGDCMIAIVPVQKINKVKKAISKVGGEIIDIKTNAEGVAVHKNDK